MTDLTIAPGWCDYFFAWEPRVGFDEAVKIANAKVPPVGDGGGNPAIGRRHIVAGEIQRTRWPALNSTEKGDAS